MPTLSTIPTIDQIKECLTNAAIEARNSRSNNVWTRTIMEHIGKQGSAMGWAVACGKFPEADHRGDWLFDITWYQADDEGQLLRLGLVMESEWGPYWTDVRFDFEKLLVADAPVKVMVFEEVRDVDGSAALFEKLKERVKAYQGNTAGQKYLFACFKGDTRGFEFEVFEP